MGDLCRRERRFRPVPVQASSAQVEVAREVLRARDLLIDLEKVALHPAVNEEWKVVFDLKVRIEEALTLKQPILVAFFIARRLGGDSVGEGRIHPYGPHSTQGVEANGGQGRVRGTRQLGQSPPGRG